jgi:hypothetical protein
LESDDEHESDRSSIGAKEVPVPPEPVPQHLLSTVSLIQQVSYHVAAVNLFDSDFFESAVLNTGCKFFLIPTARFSKLFGYTVLNTDCKVC